MAEAQAQGDLLLPVGYSKTYDKQQLIPVCMIGMQPRLSIRGM